ncbi:MSMEG_6728 family protein [Amycolatopsis sp. NPDC004368]
MQTFLPLPDFVASARALDRRRLGKQRVEALQVLRALVVPGYGWRHHPAAKMWTGYEEALTRYGLDVCETWCATGAADTCAVKLVDQYANGEVRTQAELAQAGELPPWLGDDALHRSHRSALVRKDPAHYEPLFPDVPPDLPYVWPDSDRTAAPNR